jgi:molybdopterin synthase catalytic subunit
MAEQILSEIREQAFAQFDLTCMHIYHSLGTVAAGEICLFVFVSSAHRKASADALSFLVEAIKAQAPIFGKEIFEDGTHTWKKNI